MYFYVFIIDLHAFMYVRVFMYFTGAVSIEDLHSIVSGMLKRTWLEQCGIDKGVGYIEPFQRKRFPM